MPTQTGTATDYPDLLAKFNTLLPLAVGELVAEVVLAAVSPARTVDSVRIFDATVGVVVMPVSGEAIAGRAGHGFSYDAADGEERYEASYPVRDERGVVSADHVPVALHQADRLPFNNGDGFVVFMHVARQRSPGLKPTVTAADADGTKSAGKQIAKKGTGR